MCPTPPNGPKSSHGSTRGNSPLRLLSAIFLFLLGLQSAHAQSGFASPFDERAAELVYILQGNGREADFFDATFLAVIPVAQVRGIASSLKTEHGLPHTMLQIRKTAPMQGEVDIAYPDAVLSFTMAIADSPPHKVIGLQLIGTRRPDDSVVQIAADVHDLPGRAGIVIAPIGEFGGDELLSVRANEQFAIASAFKLWVLAEAARQVQVGERHWSDVVPLGPRSLPSGLTQDWPTGAPMTLHSLATLMISMSDNTATDTLMRTLGRRRIDDAVVQSGHSAPRKTLPVLTTLEAFALKMASNRDLRDQWQHGDPEQRRQMLQRSASRLGMSAIELRQFAAKPLAIDSIEWFASPDDLVRALELVRSGGNAEALAILRIRTLLPEGDAARFAYVGYKGGSENGVVAMAWLLKTRSGRWYAVTGAWNNPAGPVDDKRFEALMFRAIAQVPAE